MSPTFSSDGLSTRAFARTGVLLNFVAWVVVVVVVMVVGADVPLLVTVEDLPLF